MGLFCRILIAACILYSISLTLQCDPPSQPLIGPDDNTVTCDFLNTCQPGYNCQHMWLGLRICCGIPDDPEESLIIPLLDLQARGLTFQQLMAHEKVQRKSRQRLRDEKTPPFLKIQHGKNFEISRSPSHFLDPAPPGIAPPEPPKSNEFQVLDTEIHVVPAQPPPRKIIDYGEYGDYDGIDHNSLSQPMPRPPDFPPVIPIDWKLKGARDRNQETALIGQPWAEIPLIGSPPPLPFFPSTEIGSPSQVAAPFFGQSFTPNPWPFEPPPPQSVFIEATPGAGIFPNQAGEIGVTDPWDRIREDSRFQVQAPY